ncbi:MAG: hypothetical protein E7Z92_03970 [Cyanobacteria bacterium SIG31]|nr:hypothetical protein [Cyanobacteria bacterium SIG31]
MISINTNLSSLITQRSLTKSTDALNLAIERMTTGFKINHASDNAANYSISTNMTTQLNAYDIAADNVSSGMDLASYASDIISQMQDKAARLNALSAQARNGTYGAQSLEAINSEANALISEITRLYMTAEYNNISLFTRMPYTVAEDLPQAKEDGFINDPANKPITEEEIKSEAGKINAYSSNFINNPVSYTEADLANIASISEVTTSFTKSEYKISNAQELAKLAKLTNDGVNTSGITFILAADIDLKQICQDKEASGGWDPIGDTAATSKSFKGTFDGNGHTISNLTISRDSAHQGLFGLLAGGSTVRNVRLVNVKIKGTDYVGGLAGRTQSAVTITNVSSSGEIIGTGQRVGGLIGRTQAAINDSYAIGYVSGNGIYIGGLVGDTEADIINSYSKTDVEGKSQFTGGLVGRSTGTGIISNCYSSGDVIGEGDYVGGLAGSVKVGVQNSYSTGDVTGNANNVGGLAGANYGTVDVTYAAGNVNGTDNVGGLVGYTEGEISNSYAEGYTEGNSTIGGLIGYVEGVPIYNCFAIENVSGATYVGGLIGNIKATGSSVENCYAVGDIYSMGDFTGGLIGRAGSYPTITDSYFIGNVTSEGNYTGGLVGRTQAEVNNCYSEADVKSTQSYVGGLVGSSSGAIVNSYAKGNIEGNVYVAGLVGRTTSYISKSFSEGVAVGKKNVGGLVGFTNSNIKDSYSTCDVKGEDFVGGLVGQFRLASGSATFDNSVAYGKVSAAESTVPNSSGMLVGAATLTDDGATYSTLNITDSEAINYGLDAIGGVFDYSGSVHTLLPDYDMADMLAGVSLFAPKITSTDLQVGIFSDDSCRISFDSNFQFDLSEANKGIESVEAFESIVAFENLLSEKATQLGAVQNRLESALESIEVNINNLTSSRSTIRDADIAEVSSQYIQQQILQQASATLMTTANQTPAIALQLI